MATPQGGSMQGHFTQAGATALGGGMIFGLTPEQWAGYATFTYFVVMTFYTIWKWRREAKSKTIP